jgi:hypothetical protein
MGFFSDHKSRSVGSIPVSPNRHGIKQENKSSHPSVRICKLMCKKYRPVDTKVQSRVGFDYEQRKIPLNLFTIGMESNDEHTHRWPFLVSSRNQESVFPLGFFSTQTPGFWNPMVKRCSGIFLCQEVTYGGSTVWSSDQEICSLGRGDGLSWTWCIPR